MTKLLKEIRRLVSAAIGGLILVSFFSAGINAAKIKPTKDHVYCPLQKTWVKRKVEFQPVRQNPLNRICMSDTKRRDLAIQISLKNALAIDEKGIFETLEKGVKVLDNYRELPNSPRHYLAKVRHSFSILNGKNDLRNDIQIKSQTFSFQLLSRPPTTRKITKFDFQFVRTLDKISRNINPRSPPIFS